MADPIEATRIDASTERIQKWLETFKAWAVANAESFTVSNLKHKRETDYTAYLDCEENGERSGVMVTEKERIGRGAAELSATIFQPTDSIRVVQRASGTIRDIDGLGELDREDIDVWPVVGIETRGEVGPYSRNEDDCLVLASFDVDGRRGPDHEIADIEFVVEPTE